MRKSGIKSIVILALALALLAVLNPGQADFKAYLSSRASGKVEGQDSGGLIGTLSKGAAALAGRAAAGAGGLYARKDYLFASTFSLGGEKGSLYLGLAKKLFIKLR